MQLFISFSKPALSKISPITTANAKVKIAYITVAFTPKKASISVMIAGFKIGDVSKKEIAPQNGAPLLNKPTSTGIVEQEQNGVTAPRRAPRMLFSPFLGVVRMRFIRSCET